MDFLHLGDKRGRGGGSERCLGFGAWEDIGVIAIVNLEGAFSHRRVGAVVVGKGGK